MSSSTHPSQTEPGGRRVRARVLEHRAALLRVRVQKGSIRVRVRVVVPLVLVLVLTLLGGSPPTRARRRELPPRHSANAHVAAHEVGPVAGRPTAERVRGRFMRHLGLPPPRA